MSYVLRNDIIQERFAGWSLSTIGELYTTTTNDTVTCTIIRCDRDEFTIGELMTTSEKDDITLIISVHNRVLGLSDIFESHTTLVDNVMPIQDALKIYNEFKKRFAE